MAPTIISCKYRKSSQQPNMGYINENIITNMYNIIFHMVVHLTNIGYFPRSLIMILTPDTIPRYHGLLTGREKPPTECVCYPSSLMVNSGN